MHANVFFLASAVLWMHADAGLCGRRSADCADEDARFLIKLFGNKRAFLSLMYYLNYLKHNHKTHQAKTSLYKDSAGYPVLYFCGIPCSRSLLALRIRHPTGGGWQHRAQRPGRYARPGLVANPYIHQSTTGQGLGVASNACRWPILGWWEVGSW